MFQFKSLQDLVLRFSDEKVCDGQTDQIDQGNPKQTVHLNKPIQNVLRNLNVQITNFS